MTEIIYKTPAKKLAKFFEDSRDAWKQRAQDAAREAKLKRNRIKFLEESKEKLRQENRALKKRLSELESGGLTGTNLKKNTNK